MQKALFNSGFVPSIDGTEFIYSFENNDVQLPVEFSYMKNLPGVLDQGQDPICVPCSISAWLEYKLSLESGIKKGSSFRLYDIFDSRTTKGEGMTCKEAFKYIIDTGAKYKGGIIKGSAYYSIRNLFALRHALISNGPCVAVLPVYDLDSDEFWTGNGLKGYHAVSVVGYDQEGFIIRNSWGEFYGDCGYYYISNDDMHKKSKEIWTLR